MDQNPVVRPIYDFKSARKQFSRIGLALVAFFAATYAAMFLIEFILAFVFQITTYSAPAQVLLSCVCMYGVGVPVFCLCLRGTKHQAPSRGKVRLSTIGILFLISYALTYVGNTIGTLAAALLEKVTGLTLSANATDLIAELPWYITLLYAVVVGPFFEEFVFRKQILDRTRAYGEKTAIFFSALMFAFFHMNPEQFFYAFAVGLVFGYLYLRTGKLTACWLLHGTFNFFGGLLPSVLMQHADYNALLAAESVEAQMQVIAENPIAYVLVLVYSFCVLAAALAGFILLGFYLKRLHFAKAECTLPPDSEAGTTLINVGVILFIALCSFLPFLEAALVQSA